MRNLVPIFLLVLLMIVTGCAAPTPLQRASMDGDVKAVRALVEGGADIEEQALWSARTISSLVPSGTALHAAVNAGRADIVRILIENGADVNAKGAYDYSPLHYAAWNGHVNIVRMLLDNNADPGVASSKGKTSLKFAEFRGHTTIARMLREAEEKLYMKASGTADEAPTSTPESPKVKSDVDLLPAIKAKPRSNAYAVVIGIEKYRGGLPTVDFALSDAETVTKYLTRAMGYPEENVVTLLNDRASMNDIKKYIEAWLPNNVEEGGTVFIYYSGHGAPNPRTGDAYIVPFDGDPAFIDKTGYPLARLYESLGTLPAKEVVVMLDSCFSGAGGRSVIAEGARPLVITTEDQSSIGKNTVVLAAATGGQISSTYKDKGHGLFTYFMLKGLKGEADNDGDGRVELGELYDYVTPNVKRIARKYYNNEQTPQLITSKEKKTFLIQGLK